jgi:hypothetical protein
MIKHADEYHNMTVGLQIDLIKSTSRLFANTVCLGPARPGHSTTTTKKKHNNIN